MNCRGGGGGGGGGGGDMNISAMGNTCCAFTVRSVIRIKDQTVSVLALARVPGLKAF